MSVDHANTGILVAIYFDECRKHFWKLWL